MSSSSAARYQIGILQVIDTYLPDHTIRQIGSWRERKLLTGEQGLQELTPPRLARTGS